MLAARLTALGVPNLIVEKNPRIGDSWRNRYRTARFYFLVTLPPLTSSLTDTLCLHDPVSIAPLVWRTIDLNMLRSGRMLFLTFLTLVSPFSRLCSARR